MNELISVIVPVYNGKDYLCRCVESLKEQTYSRLEILLIDDGSTDGTYELTEMYGREEGIRVFHQKNRGEAAARNLGIREAKGAFLGFCAADDFVHPEMFAELHRQLTENEADIAVCGFVHAGEGAARLSAPAKERSWAASGYLVLEKLLRGEAPLKSYAWNKLYRKELFSEIVYPEGKYFEDQFVTWKLFRNARRVAVTNWKGYYYVRRPDSMTNGRWDPREMDYLEAWDEIRRYCREEDPVLYRIAADQLVSAAIYTAGRMRKSGIRNFEAEKSIRHYIAANARGYGESKIHAVTKKRRAIALLCRIGAQIAGDRF